MTLPIDDPLLDHYARLYADRTGDSFDQARRMVDGRPNMQALLGRVPGDMTYAEACQNAGIEVPAVLPEPRAIATPDPAQVPAAEVPDDERVVIVEVDEPFGHAPDEPTDTEPEPERDVEAELAESTRVWEETGVLTEVPTDDALEARAVEAEVPVVASQEFDERFEGEIADAVAEHGETGYDQVAAAVMDAEVVQLRANTAVTLTYAALDRHTHSVVVHGQVTDDHRRRITAALQNGLWLIPEQVGLPNPRPSHLPIDRHDHPFVELAVEPVGLTATQARSIGELVEDLEAVPFWDAATFHPNPTNQEAAA